jgi:hypothetical protein
MDHPQDGDLSQIGNASHPGRVIVTDSKSEPQEWAPDLLQALIAGQPITGDLALYAQWAKTTFSPDAYLTPGKSGNWQHMIGACLFWIDPSTPVDGTGLPFPAANILEWWLGLLQAQAGKIPTATMFQYFGLSEPLSSVYEQFRWGSVLSIRLWALEHPDDEQSISLLTWTASYSEILCSLLALGGVGWTAQQAFLNNAPGEGFAGAEGFWYGGPTFSPVSERSEAMGLQTDLGPLWCMATGWSPAFWRRPGWAAEIGSKVLASPNSGKNFGSGAGFQAALDWLKTPNESTLSAIINNLAGIKLWSPQYWLTWPEHGLLVYKTAHQNGNTPCIFWSWSDFAAQSITLGWPWPPGRNREQSPPCGCSINEATGEIVATVQEADAVVATLALPSGSPTYSVAGDTTGIRLQS